MKSLRVAVRYPADAIHPMHAAVCESPRVEREVLLREKVSEGTTTMLLYVEGDADAYESILASVSSVEAYHVTAADDDGFYLYVREALRREEATLAAAFERETVMVVPPVEFRPDRTMRLSLVGPSADLQAVLDDLPEAVTVEVLSVGTPARLVGGPLTDRQREAVEAASAVGYYEVPRTGDIDDVATELDCTISTASGLLRRAEARLVADLLGDDV